MNVRHKLAWAAAAVLIATTVVGILAQEKTNLPEAGSLAALTAEVRQLRQAIEKATQNQSDVQALGVYVSAQQARLLQVTSRADAARREYDDAVSRVRELSMNLASIEGALAEVDSSPAPETRQQQLQLQLKLVKAELEKASASEQQAMARAIELSQAVDVENARWSDLMARLEQLTRK